MTAPQAVKEMTDAALEHSAKAIDASMREQRDRLREVRHEIEARSQVVEAKRRVAQMNPKERAALLQALGVKSVPSAEAVGTPGAGSPPPEG